MNSDENRPPATRSASAKTANANPPRDYLRVIYATVLINFSCLPLEKAGLASRGDEPEAPTEQSIKNPPIGS